VYGQGAGAFHKSQFYDAFVGAKPSVFSTTDRQDHAQKRRLVSQAFSAKALLDLTDFIHDIVLTFVEKQDVREGRLGRRSALVQLFSV